MPAKIVLTLCLLSFGLVVPILEINQTHVFNPAWPAHARLHEVWQLATNCILAAAGLWLTWFRGRLLEASFLGLAVIGGFIGAYLLRPTYGGSMVHPDGSELTIAGINPSVAVMAAAATLLAAILWREARLRSFPLDRPRRL